MNETGKGNWLDAACGEGQLSETICNSIELHGVDIDLLRLGRAVNRNYAGIWCASITDLPFVDGSFDGITSIETLEHIEDINSALKELHRCLKPGGRLILSMPSVTLRSLYEMYCSGKPIYCSTKEHVIELSSIKINWFPSMFRTWRWLETKLKKNGFRIIKSGGVGFLFPMFKGKFSFLEKIMNLLYREKINKLLGIFPVIKNYPYYRIYILKSVEKSST